MALKVMEREDCPFDTWLMNLLDQAFKKHLHSYVFNNIVRAQIMTDPKNYWAKKAEELKKEGKFEEAIKILDKVQKIEQEERHEDFWYNKALQFCEIGEYKDAKEALESDLEKNGKKFHSFFLMGKIQYNLGEYEESLESYNKASEEYNRKQMKHSHKIDHMKNAHKFEEAVKYSDLIYQEKDLSDDFWINKGRTLIKLGKNDEASSCFDNVLTENPKETKALYELAKIELQKGDKQKSIEILEKICVVDPSISEKLKIDKEFEQLYDLKQFRIISGLLSNET